MKLRPKREDYASGVFGECEYTEALEAYIDYLLRYRVKKSNQ